MQLTSSACAWITVVSLGIAALVGCAVGDDPGNGVSDLTNVPTEAGPVEGDENVIPLPSSSADASVGDATPDSADAAVGAPDAGPHVDAGSDGGVVVVNPTCASANTCLGATALATVSGDTGAGIVTAQGSTSEWFKIRVTENDSSVFGLSLLLKAQLVSPPGTNFDVFLYVAGDQTAQECSAVAASATTSGLDVVTTSWGEGAFSNGSQDDRTVTVEVRNVSGTCAPTAKWSLTLFGDTP